MNESVALVVFDLAGTTVRDTGDVTAAFMAALHGQGIDVSEKALAEIRGRSKRQAIAALIPDGPERARRADATYATFREYLVARYRSAGVRPFDGVEALFQDLRARGIRVALNTGFEREIADVILKHLHWDLDVVDAIVCGDDVSHGRPAPFLIFRAMERTNVQSVHAVVNVGDTASDLHAGYHAGVRWNVGVLTGAHDRDTLARAPHTRLIASLGELTQAVP